MSDIAIRVENLGKLYRLGHLVSYETLTDTVTTAVSNTFSRLKGGSKPKAKNLGSEYIWALKGVSFEVKRGEVMGVIGPNGAGKSTLLKILTRITTPTEGYAEIHGRVGSLLEVGTGFHSELSGRENIYLSGAVLGMKKAEIDRKFDEIVDFSGVERFIDTPIKRYSSGMQVRLAFSVAAHLEPEVLLVDEVLAVGDADFRRKCLGKMQEVTGEGRTVVFVSHNMQSIEKLCHEAILLEDGKITFRGDPASTVAQYLGTKDLVLKSFVDLREHPGRTTTKVPIFQSVRLLNHREEETQRIQVGDGVIFEMILDVPGGKLHSPRILVSVINSSEMRIVEFFSEEMMTESYVIEGQTLVRCYWDECRLVPGNYSLILKLREYGVVLDRIFEALNFEVLQEDVYGTGKIRKSPGVILPKGRWEIKALNNGSSMVEDSE